MQSAIQRVPAESSTEIFFALWDSIEDWKIVCEAIMEDLKISAVDKLKQYCAQREMLESSCSTSMESAQIHVNIVDRGLSALDPDDRIILERFYIAGQRGSDKALAAEFSTDVHTIQQQKDVALRKFTIALYGCTVS